MRIELPNTIAQIFANYETSEALFSELMPVLSKFLDCDRCFLYLRDPETSCGSVEFCWVRDATIPKIYNKIWKKERESLASEDPMFAAALRTEPSIFVEDVKTANPKILNHDFEEKRFGHRALVHAHLCQDGQLWGILQPCIFNRPRSWTKLERQIIEQIVLDITPIAVRHVTSARK